MGKQQVHFEFDEIIWRQFQDLYPRQARTTFENLMRSMINFKLDITDEEGEQLKTSRDKIQQELNTLTTELQHQEMKLQIWEGKKRKELIKEKKLADEKEDQKTSIVESLKASGVLLK